MKRLIPCFLLLPLLSSCVVQEGYYEPGYYPPPPPPRVEIHRHDRHHQPGYRPTPVPRVRVEHGHGNSQANVHGNNHAGGRAVVVSPGRPQAQSPAHVPPQAQVKSTAHGHDENNGSEVKQSPTSGSGVVVEHN